MRDDQKAEFIRKLEKDKILMKSYLMLKFEEEDFHGVQDAASDLRDIEAKLMILGN